MAVEVGKLLIAQLDFYWEVYLWPKLQGLTDEEYFWEPVTGCWNLRLGDDGRYRLDREWPDPHPAPVTTIAWRLNHVAATGLANRARALFDDDVPPGITMNDPRLIPTDLPGSAPEGLAFLDRAYHRWRDGVAGLDPGRIAAPLGPRGGDYANDSMADLMAHINREVMHHGGEICLLRDLYRASGATSRASRLIPVN